MSTPEVRRVEDNPHFIWWIHDCSTYLGEGERPKVRLPLNEQGWHVVQEEPLSVQPSILCNRCNTHGFMTDGKWISV